MGPLTGIIVFLLAIIASVVIGQKIHCNIGIIGLCFAFIIGTCVMGKSVSEVIEFFPTSLMFMMMVVTFFYGYASKNGAIKGIADRIIYLARNHVHLLPLYLFATCFIVAALGAGAGATSIMLSPIAFGLAAEVGFNPILAFLALALGSLAGGLMPWTSSGVMFQGIAETYLGTETAVAISWAYAVVLIIAAVAFYLIAFFVLSRHNERSQDYVVKKPEPFNKKQKQTIALILIIMILIIVPVLINSIVSNPVTTWMSSHLDIKVLCVLGIAVASALKLGDSQDIIKNSIPWNMIIMICGMSTLISLSIETGMADFLGNWLGTSVPTWLIPPMLIILAGLLSFVTTGPAVIFPLFIPMFPSISAATGLSPVLLTVALFAGTGATGMSPFSQGGASAMTGCQDEKTRNDLFMKQLLLAFLFLGFYVILCLLGVFNLISGLFA